MVVFTCQHCNACLKKAVVEKHYYTVCRRNEPYLTCIDCLKDFRGKEYDSHTSCLTEDQRYGGKDFVQKPHGVKQTNWVDFLLEYMKSNTNSKYANIFQRISNLSNIPRKKNKFINFCKNNCIRELNLAGEVFDLFQEEFGKVNKKNDTANGSPGPKSSNTLEDISNTEKVDKKEKQNDVNKDSENKKSKKQKVSEVENESFQENTTVDDNSEGLDTSERRKKKKKKKSEIETIKENHGDQEVKEPDNTDQNSGNVPITESQSVNGLSKKELKKLKKKQKYEAALKEIETEEPTQLDELHEDLKDTSTPVDTSQKKSKKDKKRKNAPDDDETQSVKKQKFDENVHEENEVETVVPNGKAKFHWDEVIKGILEHKSDHEMSIKRLSKKVLAEYQAIKGDRESYEELISKFNKKINKIPGVKIFKDKAKLQVDK